MIFIGAISVQRCAETRSAPWLREVIPVFPFYNISALRIKIVVAFQKYGWLFAWSAAPQRHYRVN